VGREHHGASLFVFLDATIGPLDRPAVRMAAESRQILLNGELGGPSVTLKSGDQVELLLATEAIQRQSPEALPILVQEDQLIIAVKPTGVAFDAGRANRGDSAMERLSEQSGGARPRAPHRLDKFTSGLVVAALSRRSEAELAGAFRNGSATMEYLAVVRRPPKADEGTIDIPLGKSKRSEAILQPDPKRGRACVTHWRVSERLRGFAVLTLTPEGGRSHQVRAHLACQGFPALCDRDYGEDDRILLSQLKLHYRSKRGRPERALFDRPAVHASTFRWQGREVTSPLPEDMDVLLKQLRRLRPLK
jgi:23S rRNA pseudouridine1911/1915/1917 synthase